MNPLSGVISDAWRMYRAHALHLLVIALAIYLPAAILEGILLLADWWVISVFSAVIGLLALYLLQAALVKAVQDVRDGRADLSLGETVSAALPSLPAVAVASVLASIAVAIGLALLIVPGLYLITIWAVIIPVIVIERAGPLRSFWRSQELVRGRGWYVFGTLVLILVIYVGVELVIGAIFAAAPRAVAGGIGTLVSGTLIMPFLALVVTLMYYRLVGTPPDSSGYGQPTRGYGQPPAGAPAQPPGTPGQQPGEPERGPGQPVGDPARRPPAP